MVGLIGPNGSGKTTLFDCLSRVQSVDEGQIVFDGVDITRSKPHNVAHLGLARTFQVIRVYRDLTVLETWSSAFSGATSASGHSFDGLIRQRGTKPIS